MSVLLKSVTDLDADAPLVRRNKQQHTIVFGFLAELPVSEQFIGIRLDVLAFQRVDRGNHKLDAGLAFEIGKLCLPSRYASRAE